MPQLLHLTLEGTVLDGEFCDTDWAYVFDAIRDHPNVAGSDPKGLYVHIEAAMFEELRWEGTVCRDANLATERHAPNGRPNVLEDSKVSLEMHFYGEVPFRKNYSLRRWLHDWLPRMGYDASDSDSDSEDDEDAKEERWRENRRREKKAEEAEAR